MTLLNEITKIENGRIFMADRAGDKTAYKKYLIGETLLGKFWIEKDEAVILHEVESIAKAKAEIDKLVTSDRRLTAKDATDEYEVNVGNVGNISCSSKSEALSRFDEYVRQSKASSGRASGEDVVLLKNGEIIKEYNGTATKDGGPGSGQKGHVIGIQRLKHFSKRAQEIRRRRQSKELAEKKKQEGPFKDSSSFSPDEAKAIGETVGVDFTKICPKQFAVGLAVELEHSDLTQGDSGMTAKIVLAHLKEDGQYYTKLAKMESGTGIKDQRGACGGTSKRDGSGMGVENRPKDGSSLKMKLKDILRKRK